jgi:hypothetical protein
MAWQDRKDENKAVDEGSLLIASTKHVFMFGSGPSQNDCVIVLAEPPMKVC